MDDIIKFNKNKVRSKIIGDDVYFSIVDIVSVLTESSAKDKGSYWRKLKERLIKEGFIELVTNCHELKLK
ncbi:MAG: ATPase [Candidatus Pacebacteria bacterium]|nr:ATPase [Candidatus Paceibacterota bacterium]